MSNKKKNNSKQKNTEQQKKTTSGLTEFPFSEEKYIELQAEAFYRAIKRVEKRICKKKKILRKSKKKTLGKHLFIHCVPDYSMV